MFNDLSLSSILQMRHGIFKKEREKDGMPKKHDPKKRKKNGHMKVQEKKGDIQ